MNHALKVADSITDLIGSTPLIKLLFSESKANLYAKLEYMNPGGSVKDRIAKQMIEAAESRGVIKPGDTISARAQDYQKRKRLFTDKESLLKFAQETAALSDPARWNEFEDHCKKYHCEPAKSIAAIIGEQQDFEDQLGFEDSLSLDIYVLENLKDYIDAWKNTGYQDPQGIWNIPLTTLSCS